MLAPHLGSTTVGTRTRMGMTAADNFLAVCAGHRPPNCVNPAAMPQKRQWLTHVRDTIGPDFPLLSAIAVRPKATPELIRQGVQIAVECGVAGITLGHYDGAEFPMLRAIRDGLADAKVPVPPARGG